MVALLWVAKEPTWRALATIVAVVNAGVAGCLDVLNAGVGEITNRGARPSAKQGSAM